MAEKMKDVIIMVKEDHRKSLSEVTRQLQSKGFVLKESLGEIGILTGTIPAGALGAVSSVAGVSSVEENRNDYRTQS